MAQPYSQPFYTDQQTGSADSAEIVVPLVLSLFQVHSVIDVGCGVGGWLKAFEQHGITDYIGLDGDYVPRSLLKIPKEKFIPCDLTRINGVDRRFDLACSLEVAEHLPESSAENFVSFLVKVAPVVLFSAAIPGQGGKDHRNEQWQSYWAKLFATHGYVSVDCIRPTIFYDNRVEIWYRQNILIFCEADRCPPKYVPARERYDLDRIHPELLSIIQSGPNSGKAAARATIQNLRVIAKAIMRKARRCGRI